MYAHFKVIQFANEILFLGRLIVALLAVFVVAFLISKFWVAKKGTSKIEQEQRNDTAIRSG
jgi:hypothetical protein